MKVEPLIRPFRLAAIRDGGCYAAPEPPELKQTNLFLRIASVDDVYVKVPSERGLADYRRFILAGHGSPEDMRALEEQERFEHLDAALAFLPELAPVTAIGRETAHYLAVHRLQNLRLQRQSAVRIPQVRFGALQSKGWGFLRKWEPAMFQEKVPGATLWEMFDFETLSVHPRWRPALPLISERLGALLDSGLPAHIDWNIGNFVFDESARDLWYVDLKPSTFVARSANERNLAGIRRYYLA